MSAIDVENLGIALGGQWILRRLNLRINGGGFCVVTGSSGSGKSTFVRILLSQLLPTEGRVLFDGRQAPDRPTPDRGVVFQNYSVFAHKSALDNIVFGLKCKVAPHSGWIFGRKLVSLREQAMHALAQVGLDKAASKYPHELSGGMCQRLAIAQAMIARPKILLLDEPFGALDPVNRGQLHALTHKLWRETEATIVMVTHDQSEAQMFATQLLRFELCQDRGHTRVRIEFPDGGPIAPVAIPVKRAASVAKPSRKQRKKARSRR